jgi:putative FmdB family regulatory protein
MPIYEYECTKCHKHFEIMRKISDDPLTSCRECGGELKKLITNTSFVLKGAGWYVTDYPSADRKKAIDAKKPKAEPKAESKDKGKDKDSASEKKTDFGKKAVNS